MGAYHGAQACEIVGLYMLNQLSELPDFSALLYRDDGLGISNLNLFMPDWSTSTAMKLLVTE